MALGDLAYLVLTGNMLAGPLYYGIQAGEYITGDLSGGGYTGPLERNELDLAAIYAAIVKLGLHVDDFTAPGIYLTVTQ